MHERRDNFLESDARRLKILIDGFQHQSVEFLEEYLSGLPDRCPQREGLTV